MFGYGALAQLGEHLLCKQGVIGSIPIGSTKHYPIPPEMKTTVPPAGLTGLLGGYAGFARFFDIVNGFFNRCRNAWHPAFKCRMSTIALLTDANLAEITVRTYYSAVLMQGCC